MSDVMAEVGIESMTAVRAAYKTDALVEMSERGYSTPVSGDALSRRQWLIRDLAETAFGD